MVLATRIVPSVAPVAVGPAQVKRELESLLRNGARLCAVGQARDEPERLLHLGYTPKYRVDLFDTRFYLTNVRQNPDLRFFVAYVMQTTRGTPTLFARIFYKDLSLIWRAASHMVHRGEELWIGKGEVTVVRRGGYEWTHSLESTTDLPLELQDALDALSRRTKRIPHDVRALDLVLRNAPSHRIAPYADFSAPRARARADRTNLIHGGKPIARFTREGDPRSLHFVPGYEPDLRRGVLERTTGKSTMYGGALQRFRILSRNRRVQYLFIAAPQHTWIIPPQATTTELSSFGVRTIHVAVDEDLCVPGYEYHFVDEAADPPALHTQIPAGFAGQHHPDDPDRADASAWLDALPVLQRFKRVVLERRPG